VTDHPYRCIGQTYRELFQTASQKYIISVQQIHGLPHSHPVGILVTLYPDQIDPKKECRANLDYVDHVIENVHRHSRDLSPSMLKDLGLWAALRWLINNFAKDFHVEDSY